MAYEPKDVKVLGAEIAMGTWPKKSARKYQHLVLRYELGGEVHETKLYENDLRAFTSLAEASRDGWSGIGEFLGRQAAAIFSENMAIREIEARRKTPKGPGIPVAIPGVTDVTHEELQAARKAVEEFRAAQAAASK